MIRRSPRSRGWTAASFWLLASSLGAAACEADTCDEDPRAQVLDERIELVVGTASVEAEVADTPGERERGWRYRRCDREALWLVPDVSASPLPVWGCGLASPIDVLFVADGAVVAIERDLEPCGGASDCGGCALVGEGLEVDGVLEVPAGSLEARRGDPVVPAAD